MIFFYYFLYKKPRIYTCFQNINLSYQHLFFKKNSFIKHPKTHIFSYARKKVLKGFFQ